MKTMPFSIYLSVFALIGAITTVIVCPTVRAADAGQGVFVTLTRTVSAATPTTIDIPVVGNGWNYSAAAAFPGTKWNAVNFPSLNTTFGTFPEDAAFRLNSINGVSLVDSDGNATTVALTGDLIVTVPRTSGEPGSAAVAGGSPAKHMDKCWRVYTTGNYMRFTLGGLIPSKHYLIYCYATSTGANQGARFDLDSGNWYGSGTASFVDIAGYKNGSTPSLFVTSNGKITPNNPTKRNIDSVSDDNALWGALHAVATGDGKITVRTAKSKIGTHFFNGFQLVPYPVPAILEQPDTEPVGVLNEVTELMAISRDIQYLADADQNPLTCIWQVSKDNGGTWTDISNPDTSNAFETHNDVVLGSVASTLEIKSTKTTDAGLYRLKVTNVAGGITYSNNSPLTVITAPAPFNFTQQPVAQNVTVGDNVNLSAGVTGTPPFTFTWQKSDTADFAAFTTVKTGTRGPGTTNTFNFPFIRRSDLGYYRVVVLDVTRRNPITSNVVYLYVEYAKPIITPSGPQTVTPGNSISLFGNVFSEIPVTAYQWQVSHDGGANWTNVTDGGAYSGTATETLHISNAAAAQAGLYRVVATNALGTTNGGAVSLAVATPLVAHPVSVAADKAGHLYVSDDTTNTLYRFALSSGTAVLFAGQSGVAGSANGFNGQATFNGLSGASVGPANTVFLADTLNHAIRYAQANGDVQTIAGSPTVSDNIDGTGPNAAFSAPAGVSYDAAGNLYVADKTAHTIRRITPVNYDVSTLAGVAGSPDKTNGKSTEGNVNAAARFNSPGGIVVSPYNIIATSTTVTTYSWETPTSGTTTLFVADTGNNIIRRIFLTWYRDRNPIDNQESRTRIQSNDVMTIAGSGSAAFADGTGTAASFNAPMGIAAFIPSSSASYGVGDYCVADTGNNIIRKIHIRSGTIAQVTTIGGLPGISGYQDGPDADSSLFNQPRGVSVDPAGNVYVADTGNSAIRMISPDGKVSTLVFTRGADPVPPTSTGTTGQSGTTVIPPAGSGDRGGDLGGGGAPSLWYLLGVTLLGLSRVAVIRKHLMRLFTFALTTLVGISVATTDTFAAENPAVFVKLHRDQSPSAGVTLTTSATFAIPVQGSGWDYSGAAPYSGTVWNKILRPNAADLINSGIAGGTTPGTLGSYNLTTANNIALFAPDGTDSGVKLTIQLNINGLNANRQEPNAGYISGYNQSLMPSALANDVWRLIVGDNTFAFTLSNLPANRHYLTYFYGALDNGNARFDLAPANVAKTNASWVGIKATSQLGTHVFAVGSDSKIAPVLVAPPNDNTKTTDKPWGRLHAVTDATGHLAFSGTKFDGNTYVAGFQLIPYPTVTITTPPLASTTVSANGTATIPVVATGFDGDDVITYQWRKGGVDIDTTANPSAATAALTLTSVPLSDDNTTYDVVITNYGGSITSGVTTLSVTTGAVAPSISTQPVAQTAVSGGAVALSVSANGTSPLTYTWQKSTTDTADASFTDIPSSNAAALTLASVTAADAGYYRVKITNGTLPDAVSDATTLIVAPVITTQPTGAVVAPGAPASLTVVATTGIAAAPFAPTYEWKRNGTTITDGAGISGATSATLQFSAFAATNSGNYTVTIANGAGSVISSTVYLGTPATMTATQWPLNGATNINPDTPLKLTFTGGTPVLGDTTGKVVICDADTDAVVETIDVSALVSISTNSATNLPGYASRTLQGRAVFSRPIAIYGNEVWITLSSSTVLQYGKTYYVTIEPGVLFDTLGATYPGMSGSTTWRFSTRAAAPDISSRTIRVAADGTRDTTTIQGALNMVPQNNTAATPYLIEIAPGTYSEQLYILQNRSFVTLRGTGAARTDVYVRYHYCGYPNTGVPVVDRVAQSYTDSLAYITASDVRYENFTIENISGPSYGQQLAVYTTASRQVFDNMLIKGYQDTLRIGGSATAYLYKCEVWGTVDFIYDGGTGYFDQCDIIMIRGGGWVTAPSTSFANPYGFVFNNCRMLKGRISTGQPEDVPAGSSYLQRPWRQDGMTALINCQLDDHISVKGWDGWSAGVDNTCRVREYGSTLIANGSSVSIAARQAAGAFWVNTIDPDYTVSTMVPTDALLAGSGRDNRVAVNVDPADYTIEAVFGNAAYALGTWRPSIVARIATQPVAQTVTGGGTITLSVGITDGFPASTVQWYHDGVLIPGATSPTLGISNAAAANAGAYHAIITNAAGSITTSSVNVTVNASTLPTGSLKVDINRDTKNTAAYVETDFIRWSEDTTGGAATGTNPVTKTFTTTGVGGAPAGTVTISFSQTGLSETRGGAGLVSNHYEAGVQAGARLISDGITVAPANLGTGGQLQMTLTGLSAGTHSLVTYHNAWDNIAAGALGPINISVNGTEVVSGLQQTIRAASTAAAASAYLSFTVASPTDVVTIIFAADDATPAPVTIRNPMINGFELNTSNVSKIANTSSPANADEHVDAPGRAITLSWAAALAGGIASHDVYFGTNLTAVETATHASPEFKGNQTALTYALSNLSPHLTYYWRIDEVDTSSAVTKGTVWMFRTRQLAFPDAEGYGRFARGGRGGKIVHVTSLADYTGTPVPGTLRYAIEQETGPRTIVFDVGGLITLESRLTVSSPYVTIAGQTAPGKGITLRKYTMGLSGAKDVIVRYMRSRPGKISGTTIDGMGMSGSDHAIMDHCSISWSLDEAFSSRSAKNITLQRTLISEALNTAGHQNYPAGTEHGYAASIGGDKGSFHHNLLAHNYGRNWSLAGGLDGANRFAGRLDITNNVVYNWGSRTTDGGAAEVNFVNNYYKPGAGSTHFYALTIDHENDFGGAQQAYFAGNVMPGKFDETTQDTGRRSRLSNGVTITYETFVTAPFFESHVTTQTASDAYKRVISDVGANLPLDDHDARVIQETISGTFTYRGSVTNKAGFPDSETDVGGWEDYPTITRAANWDSDGDGLPDWWEAIKGTNANSPAGDFSDANADTDTDGYTNLDDYLNWLATPNVSVAQSGTVQIDLARLTRGYTASPVHVVSGAQNGTVTLDADGHTATFTPAASFTGLASFAYTVTDSASSTMSGTLNIRVTAASSVPVINTQPAATQTVIVGNGISFSVAATSGGALAYQWYKDGAAISGATAATYTIASAQTTDAGSYTVTVTNTADNISVTSSASVLTVDSSGTPTAPAITAQPVSQVVTPGTATSISVTATGGSSYQWYKNGVAISGATGATYALANPQGTDTGSYYVKITNAIDTTTSATVTLTVQGAAPAPAVFVNLSTTQSGTAGVVFANAPTFTISAPGNGWNYGAAAPYSGETWNNILSPHNDDRVIPQTKGYARYDVVAFVTATNIALVRPDGTASGVTLTASAILDDAGTATNAREVPRLVNVTNATPPGLMGTSWRIFEGGNRIGFTFEHLPVGAHYLAYCYASTNGANQGARFVLDPSNSLVTTGTMYFETNPVANTNPTIFVDTAGVLVPSDPAPLQTASNASGGANTNTTWGVFHAKVNADGKVVISAARNANNNGYLNGLQLIPYPKATISADLLATASVAGGDTTTLTVVAAGNEASDTLTYQWRKGGVPINTATNATANTASLVISNASAANAGEYDVVITNFGGSLVSSACVLTVTAGTGVPSIITAPLAQTGTTGDSVSFNVAAGGMPPLGYVWQKSTTGTADADFSDIAGATNSALSLSNITMANAGYYRVKVTNPLDTTGVVTTPVTLIVTPVITTQPASAIISVGAPASLTVVANTGIAAAPFAPTYRWYFDGTALTDGSGISGATAATLNIASFAFTSAGSYTVVVTNGAGSVTSTAAVLGNPVMPVFTAQPAAAQTVLAGQSVTFVSSASGVPAPTYLWSYNGTPITSATTASYMIASTAFASSGTYTVEARNTAGYVTSNPAVLTVLDPAGSNVVADGYGAATTGGAGGQVYIVTTAADLSAKLALTTPAIITISGTINAVGGASLNVASNKTLQGADANATIIGTINVKNVQNVIIRGINVTNPGTTPSTTEFPRYVDGGDGITIQNSTNVLITHCTFYDCADGMCDLTYTVRNATVSWCKFYYTSAQANHRFTMILGNEGTPVATPITATLHHNWWGPRCDQRMPASSNARGHMYDNYFTCAGNSYSNNARDNTQLFIEHSYYDTGVKNPVGKSAMAPELIQPLIRTIGNTYNGTTGSYDAGTDLVFTPPYSYELNPTASVPTLIPQYAGNTAGAFSVTPAANTPMSVVGIPATLLAGDTVSLLPSIAGGTSFQWRRNNFDIPGATSETLTLTNIQTAQLGVYTVVVGNSAGNVTVTAPATLTFSPAPIFTGVSGGAVSVVSGKNITLQPSTSGARPTYQWQKNTNGTWIDIPGATNAALVISNASAADVGQYRLVATNATGSNTTNPYTLTVAPVLFPHPTGIAVDAYGDLFVADSSLNVIRKVTPSGSTSLYAGIPNTAGYYDGAFGLNTFNAPAALAIDAFGNLYVADTGNAIIRRIARDGSVETMVGDPTKRGSRDAIGTAALLTSPNGLTFDRTNGVTYFADTNIHAIRRLTPIGPSAGLFVGNTVATISGVAGANGNNDVVFVSGTATGALAHYDHPAAVAFSGSFLYVADAGNNTIRRVILTTGTAQYSTTTLAGLAGVSDTLDGIGADARFNQPKAIVTDASGANIYVADTGNHTIRRVTSAGVVTTLAGLPGISGLSDGVGIAALFNQPTALAIDVSGSNLYVADTGNAAVRKITISGTTATVSTISVATSNDTVPSGTSTPFTPTVDSNGGGGGAPSPWYLAALAALALTRFLRREKKL